VTLEETAEEEERETSHQTDGGPQAADASQTDAGPQADAGPAAADADSARQDLIDAGESPECPDCGSLSLYYSEGCKTCESCGWSEC